jgi:hypothetical protein
LIESFERKASSCRRQAHNSEHFADQFGIERGGWFVEQHQARRNSERTCDRDALLLAAGQSMRQFVGVLAQPDAGEKIKGRVRAAFGLSP